MPKEMYEQYSDLVLKRSLDSMSDVVDCPFCKTPVLLASDNFGMCGKCNKNFCAYCFQNYHPLGSCTTKMIRTPSDG